VLSIRPFRRLWIAISLSSLGDWLSLLALTTLASALTSHHGPAAQGAAVGGVWLTALLPALILGPLAGAVADKFDRRVNMIVGDVLRAALYLSIPLDLSLHFAGSLTWMYTAQFLASCASLFWTPAKDASVPNLVPPGQLEQANQLSLLTTYGTAPVAALLFVILAWVSRALGTASPYFTRAPHGQVNLALYFTAATFAISAVTVYTLREIAKRQHSERISSPSVVKSIWEGWRFIGRSAGVRGLVIGMVGAFAAGGVVVGLGQPYVQNTLDGGPAGWGSVFAAIFIGLAAGLFLGLRILRGFSRRRLFGLAIVGAGIPLALIGLIPNLAIVIALVGWLGASAGVAYVTGYTIVGLEVDDDTRGRTFAFLQSAIRVIMFAVFAVAPFLAAIFTEAVHSATGSDTLHVGNVRYTGVGFNIVLLLAALVAILLGLVSYRQMDDRRGVPLLADLTAVLRNGEFQPVPGQPGSQVTSDRRHGLLLALEGGEGAGKSTQARLLAIWLRDQGYDVIATHEPGATKIGMRLRALLLDTAHTGLSRRAETLLYAADRAEHIASVIGPALERGGIVVTDRYVDSSLAYQGSGRRLPVAEIAGLNDWATGGLKPDLTIVLDLPPESGLRRRARSADRLEAEPSDFHDRVRAGFLRLAAEGDPERYLVLDATRPAADLSRAIQEKVRDILPDPVPLTAEEITGSFPAIRE
jgi:dTMP kinase